MKINLFELNKYLAQLQSNSLSRQYNRSITKISEHALELQKKGVLTKGNLNKFIRDNALDIDFKISLFDSFTAAELKLDNQLKYGVVRKLSKQYNNPLILASKIHKFSVMYSKGHISNNLHGVEKTFYNAIKINFDDNASFLQKVSKQYTNQMRDLHTKITTDLSKSILKDYRRLNRTAGLSSTDINNQLKLKYGDNTARVERILRTEMHTQQQIVATSVAIENDYLFKTWHNRPDAGKGGDVRGTNSTDKADHLMLDGKKIPINEKFKLKNGEAMYPSDPDLPVIERVNCRCELTYSKS